MQLQSNSTQYSAAVICLCVLTWFSSIACADQPLDFVDATLTSGINFVHEDGAEDQGYLVSLMGSGLGLLDFDNDGLIDAYFLNGKQLPPKAEDSSTTNSLFRNLGANKFTNVSKQSRADLSAYSLGIAVADFDNDGFKDLAISNFGSASLLRNNGDGTFSDISAAAGLSRMEIAFGAGVAFLDMENDGDLDLYIADYVNFEFARFNQLLSKSFPYPPGPQQFEHRTDHLLQNNGEGTFNDCSLNCGIGGIKNPSMGVLCGDFDGDKDTDIFVCSDAKPNLLFVNDGTGKFSQEAELYAVAYNSSGIPVGSMGPEPGDIDNDGREDIFITDYSGQLPIMFKNLGDVGFEDASRLSRAGREVIPHANWGAILSDFDNDGDRDLMIGNGHLLKWARRIEQLTDFKVRNSVLLNDGRGIFENVTDRGGAGMQIVESTRGLAADDLDNDGDIDCMALNSDAPASYIENRTQNQNNWLQVELCGVRFNRDGVGAKVTVVSGALTQTAELHSGRGYQSSYGSRLYFGLGDRTQIDRIEVDWLGEKQEVTGAAINQRLLIQQR